MVSTAVLCRHCGSEELVRNGHARNGKQMYKCKACGRNSRESSQHEKYTSEQKETIIRAYLERPSMRGIQRVFGVSRPTLSDWLKKRQDSEQQPASATGTGGDSAARPE
ncbi:MAG: IS1 family transposase [Proteobacteria bacterium]|nr:MAG: IS1 family transposase [Pseudomonadota bacterium]